PPSRAPRSCSIRTTCCKPRATPLAPTTARSTFHPRAPPAPSCATNRRNKRGRPPGEPTPSVRHETYAWRNGGAVSWIVAIGALRRVFELEGVQFRVEPVLREQLFVRAHLGQTAPLHHENDIGLLNRRKAVGDDEARAVFH